MKNYHSSTLFPNSSQSPLNINTAALCSTRIHRHLAVSPIMQHRFPSFVALKFPSHSASIPVRPSFSSSQSVTTWLDQSDTYMTLVTRILLLFSFFLFLRVEPKQEQLSMTWQRPPKGFVLKNYGTWTKGGLSNRDKGLEENGLLIAA